MTLTSERPTSTIDADKMMAFLGKVVGEFGTTASAGLVVIGDKLGLYKALAEHGPLNSVELAARTDTVERYVREWLVNQAAGGYIEYDAASGRYSMAPEQAVALTDDTSPYFIAGGFELFVSALQSQEKIERAFRSGDGLSWGAHDPGLFEGTLRFFKPGYIGSLVSAWLPALEGVVPKLEAGGKVADVGCGRGASTIIMAQAFPRSRFWGFDNHEPSIQAARQAAIEAGVADRVTFEVASASGFPDMGYDLVTFFDCLHDLGDPEAAMKRTNEALAPDGTVMIVEPMAGESVADNLNPVGRVYSAASVLICTPHALSESHSRALGTLASEAALREVAHTGGFNLFRRVAETHFNRVFEARK